MKSRRCLEALALAIVGSALSACASVGDDSDLRPRERTDFVVASTGWLSGAVGALDSIEDSGCARAACPSCPVLEPENPWLGTIGLRNLLAGSYEYGMGICVPNPGGSRVEQFSPDPLRAIAVGVWLKFDF